MIPDAAATIVPYDVQSRIQHAYPERFEQRVTRELDNLETWVFQTAEQAVEAYEHPERPPSVIMVAAPIPRQRGTIEGRVSQVEDITKRRRTFRWIVVGDDSGDIRIAFHPGRGGPDTQGQLLRVTGKVRQSGNRPMSMVNPTYHLVEEPAKEPNS
uniref:Uncharacterized protein n=1 Tax=Mycobacterium riyadhense TaxID=486698 RepID=A0A653EUQ2_9MYCO|nr:OB-fold nucleic acid binding domain-containing protein [Mycobacterium riyadhense]VTP01108.1 hypothetical protein BIN_B_03898 [Mycobacterium riyadhense]